MHHGFENKSSPHHSILSHVNHASSTVGGFRAVIVHPKAMLLASAYGIEEAGSHSETTVYCESTFPYTAFGLEPAKAGHKLQLSLDEYLKFLNFLTTLWPSARDQIRTQGDETSGSNEFHILENLWGFGSAETTFNCHITEELLFQAWNTVMCDKTTNVTELKYNARLKKNHDILWIDFQGLSNIAKDDQIERYLRKLYKGDTLKRKI